MSKLELLSRMSESVILANLAGRDRPTLRANQFTKYLSLIKTKNVGQGKISSKTIPSQNTLQYSIVQCLL